MKQLQNNFTTPEQSKRLLELGVPECTADMYYSLVLKDFANNPNVVPLNETYKRWLAYGENCDIYKHDRYFPCWSVGRLIEIMRMCLRKDFAITMEDVLCCKNLTSAIISAIEFNMMDIDFSKLEE